MHPSVLKPSGGAVGAILLASTIAARETQSVTDVWQLAPAPASLDASIIEARSTTIDSVSRYVATYEVDCPASSSPDNDGCRDLRIYPARIYHTQGSIYGGTWSSHPDNGITTTWRCELGDCGSLCAAFRAQTADCLLTIQYSQATYQILTTKVESCQVAQNSVPLAITRVYLECERSLVKHRMPTETHASRDVFFVSISRVSGYNRSQYQHHYSHKHSYERSYNYTSNGSRCFSRSGSGHFPVQEFYAKFGC
ncbi:hypothetical protein F4820DRAFT_451728 [Hypoxylon rubiginosum]|uniref:Uncharacterized protein n=1 Tax=Hypoxylon rubiginosum TaxID=110542 RepID=A0ACB9YQI0_9PEZI|nr:hypothetical protein F4820DRAFT_451728 [Hypoxylon rubiginosum]